MTRGRIELLQWINAIAETEYTTIQALGDGIAYCQILQALHPSSINVARLNLNTRYPEDCMRNTKLLEDGLKKLKLTQPASMEKLGKGKFQDNIIFVQWLYAYVMKYGEQILQGFNGYQRRMNILQKQNKHYQDISSHLVPNQLYMQNEHLAQRRSGYEQEQQNYINEYEEQPQEQQKNQHIDSRIRQINQYIVCLQNDLKQKMELNWRMMHLVDRSIEQRNGLYSLLQEIQKTLKLEPESTTKTEILKILYETPQDFQ